MVYPLGAAKSPLDLNTAVAAGTIFGPEEALLLFEPDPSLSEVRTRSLQFSTPLRLEFKGTGPGRNVDVPQVNVMSRCPLKFRIQQCFRANG